MNGTVTVGAEKLIDLTIEPSEGGATDRAEAFKYYFKYCGTCES